MDFKDPKTQKVVIAALAFFIVAYFWYSRVYSVNNQEIALKAQEFETITSNLRNVQMKAKSLDILKVEYSDMLRQYKKIEALLPEVKQIPSILVQLHTASSLTGTKITEVKPLTSSSDEFYNIASFEIKLKGTYHDFGKFTSYIANFPFIANISGMKIISPPQKPISSKNKEELEQAPNSESIIATFVLSTYFVKEEERLRELTL